MNEQKYPQFERLHILRTEALCSMRDRAFDTFPLFLQGWGDGILGGCKLFTTKNLITLGAGMIWHDNFLYLIKEPVAVEYAPTDEYIMLKIIFEPELLTENFLQRNIRVELSPDMNLSANEMELCRFKLKKGAILRTDYTDFFDRTTEFDTVNNINVPYSCAGGSTLSPEITFAFANEAKNFSLDDVDFNFCLAALSKNVIAVEQIAFYIECRLKIALNDTTNQTLYDNLCLILQDIQGGRRREVIGSTRRRRGIILD